MNDDGSSPIYQYLIQSVSFLEIDATHSTPEKRLWVAVVIRAILDYVNPPKNNHQLYATAWAFLHSESEDFGSLNWILSLISNNPEKLRRDLHHAVKEMTSKPKLYPLRVDK